MPDGLELSRREALARLAGLAMAAAPLHAQRPTAADAPVYRFTDGHWFDGRAFRAQPMFSDNGLLALKTTKAAAAEVNLAGGHVIPLLADADAGGSTPADLIQAGVFYARAPRHSGNAGDSPVEWSWKHPDFPAAAPPVDPNAPPKPVGRAAALVERAGWIDVAVTPRVRPVPQGVAYSAAAEHLAAFAQRAHQGNLNAAAHVDSAEAFRAAREAGFDAVVVAITGAGDGDPAPLALATSDGIDTARRNTIVVLAAADASAFATEGSVHEMTARSIRLLKGAAVRLAVGTNALGPLAGLGRLLRGTKVFTPYEVVQLLTLHTSRALLPSSRKVGRLSAGQEASFLVLEGDPLAGLDAVARVRLRVKQGQVVQSG